MLKHYFFQKIHVWDGASCSPSAKSSSFLPLRQVSHSSRGRNCDAARLHRQLPLWHSTGPCWWCAPPKLNKSPPWKLTAGTPFFEGLEFGQWFSTFSIFSEFLGFHVNLTGYFFLFRVCVKLGGERGISYKLLVLAPLTISTWTSQNSFFQSLALEVHVT